MGMKNFISLYILAAFGVLALAGCQTVDTVMGVPEVHFACVDGSYLDVRTGVRGSHANVAHRDKGEILYQGTMQAAESDFGQRFRAADGTSFWLNGEKGLFTQPGSNMILCHREP